MARENDWRGLAEYWYRYLIPYVHKGYIYMRRKLYMNPKRKQRIQSRSRVVKRRLSHRLRVCDVTAKLLPL